MNTKPTQLTVTFPDQRHCDLYIGHDFLSSSVTTIHDTCQSNQYFIITHDRLYELYGKSLEDAFKNKNITCHVLTVPEGESTKSLSFCDRLITQILTKNIERNDCIIGLGGGVIGDLSGLVASLCLRGLQLVHIPTTLLAQVDSSIGGKTGINHAVGKNLIGTFYQPRLILMDINTLSTLDLRESKSGFAEVIKYGVIQDSTLFNDLQQHHSTLSEFNFKRDTNLWQSIIQRSAQRKVDIVQADEKEAGCRAFLNFGHTIGHGIEAYFDYGTYRHGECVIFGMCAAMHLSVEKGLITNEEAHRLYDLIKDYGYELTLPTIEIDTLLIIMRKDKKVKKDQLHFILATSIGSVIIANDVSTEQIEKSVSFIETMFKGAT